MLGLTLQIILQYQLRDLPLQTQPAEPQHPVPHSPRSVVLLPQAGPLEPHDSMLHGHGQTVPGLLLNLAGSYTVQQSSQIGSFPGR